MTSNLTKLGRKIEHKIENYANCTKSYINIQQESANEIYQNIEQRIEQNDKKSNKIKHKNWTKITQKSHKNRNNKKWYKKDIIMLWKSNKNDQKGTKIENERTNFKR